MPYPADARAAFFAAIYARPSDSEKSGRKPTAKPDGHGAIPTNRVGTTGSPSAKFDAEGRTIYSVGAQHHKNGSMGPSTHSGDEGKHQQHNTLPFIQSAHQSSTDERAQSVSDNMQVETKSLDARPATSSSWHYQRDGVSSPQVTNLAEEGQGEWGPSEQEMFDMYINLEQCCDAWEL